MDEAGGRANVMAPFSCIQHTDRIRFVSEWLLDRGMETKVSLLAMARWLSGGLSCRRR